MLQGDNFGIQHISSKVDPENHLAHQLLGSAVQQKGEVTAGNQQFVEQLQLPYNATDEDIRDALCKTLHRDPVQLN